MDKRKLVNQLRRVEKYLKPSAKMYDSFVEFHKLFLLFYTYLKDYKEDMDKKMHQVTKRMETAEKDVKKGMKKEAVKVLNKAEKKNEKLVKIDKDVRDPMIKKCKTMMKKDKK